ncbi:cell wall-binding protein YocH [Abditibacteriota bacterium]|nr:cell wall-binding protein YocH [Abditibacteriota bacterium]
MALASACGMALLLPTTLSTQSNAQSESPTKPVNAPLTSVTAIAPLPDTKVVAQAPVFAKMRLNLVVGGQTKTAEVESTPHLLVGAALKAAGVLVGALDRITPDVTVSVTDGMTIRVNQVTNNLSKRYVPVPAQLMYRPTTAIKAGTQQQVQAPRVGKIEIVERVWTLNGKVTGREFVSKRLAVAPQPRIIALGARSNVMPQNIRPHRRYASAKGYINSFRGGSPRDRMMSVVPENQSNDITTLRPIRCFENVVTTGYAAGRAGGSLSSWTATGVRCTYGAVAVDPRLIPLGTKLYIEGYGYGFACDTGGAIKGKHIDLAFDSARAAMNHGKRRSRVWILGR